MAARGITLLAGGFVAGAAIALAIGVMSPRPQGLLGNTETNVFLVQPSGKSCTLGKETVVKVKKDKRLTWKVENDCGQPQTVRVGNFRTTEETASTNCDAATEGGATSPFQQDDEARRTVTVNAGSDGEIRLNVKPRGQLGEGELDYYFSICLDRTVTDPRLVIEP